MPKVSIASQLQKNPTAQPRRRTGPVWKGPEEDGVTQSLLSRFLCCRERFRLLVVEGLKPTDSFNHRLEYGQMWHICEEAHAREVDPLHQEPQYPSSKDKTWGELQAYAQGLCRRYPTQQEQMDHWYRVCKTQFPLYIEFWRTHQDVKYRTPLLQEQVFCVPYKLPSGRTVKLRGKWDSVDLIGNSPSCTCGADRTGPSAEAHDRDCPAGKPHKITGPAGIYLQENKTKGDIDEIRTKRQLSFDLQTMLYLVALSEYDLASITEPAGLEVSLPNPIMGVRYNVVRRPLSGGAGSIVRHKEIPPKQLKNGRWGKGRPGETKDEFYARLGGIIQGAPETYFMRWKCEILPSDVAKFRRECLDPILEQLCDWWDWVSNCVGSEFNPPDNRAIHWRHPFGVYNVLDEGGSSDLDNYLATGSEVGLQRTENLFPELV